MREGRKKQARSNKQQGKATQHTRGIHFPKKNELPQLCVLLASHCRPTECVEKHGTNVNAVLKPDGSVLVLATGQGAVLFLRVVYEKPTLSGEGGISIREHGILLRSGGSGYEVSGEGEEVERISLKHLGEAAVIGGVSGMFSLGGQLVVATGYGVLHRLTWEGKLIGPMRIHLDKLPFANDSLATTKEADSMNVVDVYYSPELHGMSIVVASGRGAFLASRSARFEPNSLQAVWLKDMTDAVCTAINSRYRLLAFGRKNGAVAIYSRDDSTAEWSLSHTLQFTKQQFPETGVQLGGVQSMEWSHGDQMVIAVSWVNGGLSLWSVFGSLLLCSLGDQPGTPSPLNPHCTILESMTWSPDGYHLWMLPVDARAKAAAEAESRGGQTTPLHRSGVKGHLHGNKEQILVMRFLKNSIVCNPIIPNHCQLFLQGCDRLYLNSTTSGSLPSSSSSSHHHPASGAGSHLSSPQWKIILLPSSYLVLNWPVKYAAVDSSGSNVAVAGKAGFALYSGLRKKWKLFGNEIQEQGLMCRGGLLWYRDVVVFPCRVQEKYEEVRFYWLHSNLDNSQLLHTIKLMSPVVKVNVYGNYLIVALRDGHITIYHLNRALLPTKGLIFSADQVHEFSVAKSVPQPWASSLISVVPSNIRTEPGEHGSRNKPIDSIFLNVAGRLLMMQQEPTNPYLEEEESWSFNHPVCLVQGIEMLWTPSSRESQKIPMQEHIMESLWLACGSSGLKVWLPLYPRDEGHPTFLSKRIMLTLSIMVYPQVVLFQEAILFGLSHETAFTEASVSTTHSFPFATVERTTHIYLHLILRQLLRRNLGSHALQIARSFSSLPYFAHVLELMLHEVLEEEAPGSMPVPDALLPRVVKFIKQFPQFLETVGSCARKTEVALWQYLFAAVGNPRDLFELCISDGRLKTAACYLIIIQNLEPVTVSRQLATRLLDAALDSNQWELCRDLVRFLRAIGPGDILDSATRETATPMSAKTPHAPPTPPSVGTTPSLPVPDLDRSAISIAKDHITSGSTSSTVSLSGDYKDASGKVIRRPQFVLDVDTKEEYFIELILSRHARKLLTATCLRDLGKFAAHLDFNLEKWLVRERLRAARIDDLVSTVRQLHKEFQWPLPASNEPSRPGSESKPTPTSLFTTDRPSRMTEETLSPTSTDSQTKLTLSPDSDTASVSSSLKRPHRPPDLDLSSLNLTPIQHQDITIHTYSGQQSATDQMPPEKGEEPKIQAPPEESGLKKREASVVSVTVQSDFDPTRSSTPATTKMSGSISERVSLVPISRKFSPSELPGDASSLGDIMEESDWEVDSDLGILGSPAGATPTKGSAQAEREIRYFVDVTLRAQCVEWTLALATLLLDASVIAQVVESVQEEGGGGGGEGGMVGRVLQGLEDMNSWAASECPGYLPFLEALQSQLKQLRLFQYSPAKSTGTPGTAMATTEDVDLPVFGSLEVREGMERKTERRPTDVEDSTSSCVVS